MTVKPSTRRAFACFAALVLFASCDPDCRTADKKIADGVWENAEGRLIIEGDTVTVELFAREGVVSQTGRYQRRRR